MFTVDVMIEIAIAISCASLFTNYMLRLHKHHVSQNIANTIRKILYPNFRTELENTMLNYKYKNELHFE